MKREIRKISDGICQLTLADERWYFETLANGETTWWPSITYITSFYPKGPEFLKWVANQGMDEAERIKLAAGDRGSIVHSACEQLLKNKVVKLEDRFKDNKGNERELTGDEYWAVMTFHRWFQEIKPEIVAIGDELMIEKTIVNRKDKYAGTLDFMFKIGNRVGVVDLKTSASVYPSHELQLSALAKAIQVDLGIKVDFSAILQVGYKRTKQGFKFTEVGNNYKEFLAIKTIWAKETSGEKPLQRSFPTQISI